jgi:hypothetical protein
MRKFINEKTVSDLRTELTNLGYSEKAGELSSGGGLQSDFVVILSYLLNEWKKQNPESCKLTFTAGNDNYHKNRKSSRHNSGEAVDVVLGPECRTNFIKILERYKSIYNGFAYLDEYTNPSKGATGGHFHLSYRQGQPEKGGKNNKEDGDESPEAPKTDTKTDSSVTTTTTISKTNYGSSIYGVLGLDGKSLKATGDKLWNAITAESTNDKTNPLNEEIARIKKMIDL